MRRGQVLCTLLSACTIPDSGDREAGLALEDLASGQASSRLQALAHRPARETISSMTDEGVDLACSRCMEETREAKVAG